MVLGIYGLVVRFSQIKDVQGFFWLVRLAETSGIKVTKV